MSNVMKIFQNEMVKTLRSKFPLWGFLAISVVCFSSYTINNDISQGLNAWAYISYSQQMVFSDIGIIFIVVFAATLLSEEIYSGTIKQVLASPICRHDIFASKMLTGILYAIVLSLFSLILSVILALTRYNFGNISDFTGTIYFWPEVLTNFILTLLLSWLPLSVAVAYGLLISAIVSNPGRAVAVTVGSMYTLDFAKHALNIESFIFTRFIGYPWSIFSELAQGVEYQWVQALKEMLPFCAINFVIMYALAYIIFTKKDYNQ